MWLEDLGIYQSLHPLSRPELNKTSFTLMDLFEASSDLGQAVYSSPLTNRDAKTLKNIKK